MTSAKTDTAPNADLRAEDLARILEMVEASEFDSIELRVGDLHFFASRHGALPARSAAPVAAAVAAPAPVPEPAAPAPTPRAAAPAAAEAPPAAPAPATAGATEGLVEVKAPIVGIFYVAPEPGAPPFVAEGDSIGPDSTLGLIEVMKVFNAVSAGVTGTVVRRLVENSTLVEYGQPLFLVRPEGG